MMFPNDSWEQGIAGETITFLSQVSPNNNLRNIKIYIDVLEYESG
jgi:hypothetical protein